MSPFASRAQMAAAFAGRLGPEMQKRAKQWAAETPNIKKLPYHVKKRRKKLTKARRKRKAR
jgi:hypothetical protein